MRKKIIFTLLIIAVYRLGAHIPTPGVDFNKVQELQKQAQSSGVFGLINLFSGGALTQFAIFALGIMPYITSSIIMQLLTVVIPRLEAYAKEGEEGQKKITQYTRYMTVVLALLQSLGIVVTANSGKLLPGLNQGELFPGLTAGKTFVIVLTLTAGTSLIMWLGELITQRGIGNGMSILIFSSVVSRLPAQGSAIWATGNYFQFSTVIAMGIGMIVGIIFVEQGQRRIPVQFAKRVVGRRMYGGQSTYIPLKVNQSGVIPIIFASSVLYFPALITGILPWTNVQTWVQNNIVDQRSIFHIVAYALLIIFFAYFYTAIAFNPQQQADIIRKQGGFIPGIRPGPPTERYLQQVLNRITLPGSIFLMVIAVIPLLVFAAWNIRQFPFGGTAILITVGVALETMKQIDSQLMMRNYEGFLR